MVLDGSEVPAQIDLGGYARAKGYIIVLAWSLHDIIVLQLIDIAIEDETFVGEAFVRLLTLLFLLAYSSQFGRLESYVVGRLAHEQSDALEVVDDLARHGLRLT